MSISIISYCRTTGTNFYRTDKVSIFTCPEERRPGNTSSVTEASGSWSLELAASKVEKKKKGVGAAQVRTERSVWLRLLFLNKNNNNNN